jgi:BlaI family penicillinase repressor
MPNIPHISEREWLVMAALWEKYPQTAAEIVDKVRAQIKIGDSSVRTLINRLIKKKAVRFSVDENNANLYHYYPLVCEEDCIQNKTRHFLELYYKNNISKFFAAFTGDADISDEEYERLRKMIDEKLGDGG